MILNRTQLTQIRAADFDFNAGFLDRMAVAVDEYLAANGLSAAGPSPGPLYEIVENHALLVEIIAGATARTSDADRTRLSGIKGLSVRLELLHSFCQEFIGMDVVSLAAQPALLELKYDEVLELQRNHVRMREKLRETIGILHHTVEGVGEPPHEPEVAFRLREAWGVATMTRENALPVFGYMPETRVVLDELGTVVDALEKLIS